MLWRWCSCHHHHQTKWLWPLIIVSSSIRKGVLVSWLNSICITSQRRDQKRIIIISTDFYRIIFLLKWKTYEKISETRKLPLWWRQRGPQGKGESISSKNVISELLRPEVDCVIIIILILWCSVKFSTNHGCVIYYGLFHCMNHVCSPSSSRKRW